MYKGEKQNYCLKEKRDSTHTHTHKQQKVYITVFTPMHKNSHAQKKGSSMRWCAFIKCNIGYDKDVYRL